LIRRHGRKSALFAKRVAYGRCTGTKKGKREHGGGPVRRAQSSAPVFIEPMAAQVVRTLPEGAEWLYEVKFDGLCSAITRLRPHPLAQELPWLPF
jgi:ATP-dependent DNA ligase